MASASSDPAPPASGASADADASGAGSSFLVVGGLGVAALHAVALPFLLPALRKHCLPYRDMFDADLTERTASRSSSPAMMADLEAKFARDLDVDAVVPRRASAGDLGGV
ncbi:hypothetical protein JL720_13954 [Aureococcus anophagefferens]|nr:hypothetical protein JL720_13954 [Aureococcus anophagefferens]